MTDVSKLKKGVYTGFIGGLTKEAFEVGKMLGIDCVEISCGLKDYMETYDFPNKYAQYAEYSAAAGIELWSIHMPFGGKLDISSAVEEYREPAIEANKKLIRAAAAAGVSTIVLHPSSEPITPGERPSRFARSRENIMMFAEICAGLSVNLAIENLPRTCLCNTSAELIELLDGTGAGICFDANHSLIEDNISFLNNIIKSGLTIHTTHLSDYDFVDERHLLPGKGINDWRAIMTLLEQAGYTGPLMYEVPRKPKTAAEEYTDKELIENQRALAAKEL